MYFFMTCSLLFSYEGILLQVVTYEVFLGGIEMTPAVFLHERNTTSLINGFTDNKHRNVRSFKERHE